MFDRPSFYQDSDSLSFSVHVAEHVAINQTHLTGSPGFLEQGLVEIVWFCALGIPASQLFTLGK